MCRPMYGSICRFVKLCMFNGNIFRCVDVSNYVLHQYMTAFVHMLCVNQTQYCLTKTKYHDQAAATCDAWEKPSLY